jgi:hypothetical protein
LTSMTRSGAKKFLSTTKKERIKKNLLPLREVQDLL